MTENNLQGVSLASGVQEETEALSSRRRFLAGSAALLAGGALAAVFSRVAQAHNTSNPPTGVDVLNYALTLEHLEYAFYRDGLKKFDEQDFHSSNLFRGLGNLLRPTVYENFRRIREHEDTHVDTLKSVIRNLGGKPVPGAEYNFMRTAFTGVEKFVSVAQFLENTGVSAYDGAIAHIEAAQLLTAGATIATVEARHASQTTGTGESNPRSYLVSDEPNHPNAWKAASQQRRCRNARRKGRVSYQREFRRIGAWQMGADITCFTRTRT